MFCYIYHVVCGDNDASDGGVDDGAGEYGLGKMYETDCGDDKKAKT